jgi:prepilin-type N-terminal cleavage/methylation domain-containing protein
MKNQTKNKGFTLSELIGVIAMVAILSGVAISAISVAQNSKYHEEQKVEQELVISKISEMGYTNIVLSPGGGYFDFYADKNGLVYRVKYTYNGELIAIEGVNHK